MKILGVHHFELTVTDLARSKRFYEKLPGFKVVAGYPNFVMFFNGSVYLGLTDHDQKNKTVFDEKVTGLDHVSFLVESRQDLDEAVESFDRKNIVHGEINKLSNDLFVLAFRDPDNIQLELCWKDK